MPLARIISRSAECSRELALDLLARGYTVEIVSPDRIPDNFADLELRVDAAPGDQLIASVEAHNGNRSSSLDFVHHLKAPMMDFIRRPLQTDAINETVNSHQLPTATEKKTLAEARQPAPRSTPPTSETELRASPPIIDRAHPIQPRDLPVRPVPVPARIPSVKASTIFRPLVVSAKALSDIHPKASEWRAALTFVGIVLLGLSMWIGMRRGGKASAAVDAAVPTQASTQEIAADAANSSLIPPAAAALSTEAATSDHASELSASKGAVPIANLRMMARQRNGREHDEDYVARDTVVYFDKRTADEAAARARLTTRSKKHHASTSNSRSGVIAANSVTYFNNKQAPKTANQEAAPKPVSDSN